jgi:hypothetical protein
MLIRDLDLISDDRRGDEASLLNICEGAHPVTFVLAWAMDALIYGKTGTDTGVGP